jgi:hypothetical protein
MAAPLEVIATNQDCLGWQARPAIKDRDLRSGRSHFPVLNSR